MFTAALGFYAKVLLIPAYIVGIVFADPISAREASSHAMSSSW